MATRFYSATVQTVRVGTAIERVEPTVRGDIITRIMDTGFGGTRVVLVVEANDADHQRNLGIAALDELVGGFTMSQLLVPQIRESATPAIRSNLFDAQYFERVKKAGSAGAADPKALLTTEEVEADIDVQAISKLVLGSRDRRVLSNAIARPAQPSWVGLPGRGEDNPPHPGSGAGGSSPVRPGGVVGDTASSPVGPIADGPIGDPGRQPE